MIKFLILLISLFTSVTAFSYSIGGIACRKTEHSFELKSYVTEGELNPEFLDMSEYEIIDQLKDIVFPFDIEALKSIQLFSFNFHGQKLRLQSHPEEDCEGVFFFNSNHEYWISGDVFDTLKPYEKVIIYLEILYFNESLNRDLIRSKAVFPLTHWAQSQDLNEVMSNYNKFLPETDMNFEFRGYLFNSRSLSFDSNTVRGQLSAGNPIMEIGQDFYDLKGSFATIIGKTIRELSSKTFAIKVEAGKFRASKLLFDEKGTLSGAYTVKDSFLKTTENEIKFFPARSFIYFKQGLVLENIDYPSK